ncbi:MAG TPA: DUF1643 domain-containing protein [Ktedonobacterales bacterium]|nr:DUF1643 domain-containing protein [Ktedonobacterales bacterium]
MVDLNSEAGAINIDGYRYVLWRNWVPNNRRRMLWIMLNPSKADEKQSDRTLQQCIHFSDRELYGGLEVVNLFAYQTPYPRKLREIPDPIGSENPRHLEEAVQRAAECGAKVVVAWGARGHKGIYKQQADTVLALLRRCADIQLYCLGTTQAGCPCHPCRLSGETDMDLYV